MSKWSSAFRDSRWQQKRLEVMERDKWTCQSCGASGEGVTLNVHHAYYESGKAPWEYPNRTLVTWCEGCHADRHNLAQLANESMAKLTQEEFSGLVDMVYAQDHRKLFRLISQQVGKEYISERSLYAAAVALSIQASESWEDGFDAGEIALKQNGGTK